MINGNYATTREKVSFINDQGETLAGLLERPVAAPLAYALFAHCFTCSKTIGAATRISRALAAQGFAVLRFDFTGLGNSEGDFANTNFSSNVRDLLSAAQHLKAQGHALDLLIGHSLGGAAVLAAAADLPDVKAVVTVGAPSDPGHIEKLLSEHAQTIETAGSATVEIGGRPFKIGKQFLDDIRNQPLTERIARLGKALLVMHSPVDNVVEIDQASEIFQAAKHPKSFISLDRADHLLNDPQDAQFAANVIAAWSTRYVIARSEAAADRPALAPGEVLVRETGAGFTNEVFTATHKLLADEPISAGGTDRGPDPYGLLLAALGACTSMTLRIYAQHKQLALTRVAVKLRHSKIYAQDCDDCETHEGKLDQIEREIALEGELDGDQRQRLLEIAEKCPVHRTLTSEVRIRSRLVE